MNKAILMGRLTRDPELRQTQSGIPVLSFTLAVERRFKNQSGERVTDFISCQAWRQTAEFIARYFQKGNRLAVVGTIQTGSYEKNGQTIYTTDVVVDEAYFCESRRDSRDSHDGQDYGRESSGFTTTSRQSGPSWSRGGSRQDSDGGSYGRSDGARGASSWNRQEQEDTFVPAPSDDTELPFDL
ncbi:MAG: single-stranded DNA-binding protein [Bacillota bacterium]|nr:single-stranded DNA-binding protein [Bacillota bacterium]